MDEKTLVMVIDCERECGGRQVYSVGEEEQLIAVVCSNLLR